ncbi:antitoxin [Rhodoferax antarcticus]|nr:AbrB/MazE/SpoVT family DNA-binding domain-containing protein [Rhodoferax antarcticus]MCW2312989.1 antitoxin VapB [Rhodoferax antarcticus]
MPKVSEPGAAYYAAPLSVVTPAAPNDAQPRRVRLFRNGANQALRIPREMELPHQEAEIRRVGDTLVISPVAVPKQSLRELLDSWEPMDEDFPDVDEGWLPLDDIVL